VEHLTVGRDGVGDVHDVEDLGPAEAGELHSTPVTQVEVLLAERSNGGRPCPAGHPGVAMQDARRPTAGDDQRLIDAGDDVEDLRAVPTRAEVPRTAGAGVGTATHRLSPMRSAAQSHPGLALRACPHSMATPRTRPAALGGGGTVPEFEPVVAPPERGRRSRCRR